MGFLKRTEKIHGQKKKKKIEKNKKMEIEEKILKAQGSITVSQKL